MKTYDFILYFSLSSRPRSPRMPRPHRGKACCVWILHHLWTVAPGVAQTLARWLTRVWPGFKER